MELKYRISHEQYDAYQRELRIIKSKKPLNVFFTIIMAVMPVSLVAILISQNIISGTLSVIFLIASVVLGILNLLLRTNLWQNGKFRLDFNFTKKQKQLTDEFWKEHRLEVNRDGVLLKCGAYKNEYSWVSFGGFKKYGDSIVPIFNATPLDLIPGNALEAYGGEEKFIEDFISVAKESMRSEFEKERNNRPENPHLVLEYSYSKERYVKEQHDARRMKYTTKHMYNKVFFAKLALTAIMIYLITTAESLAAILLYCALIIVFNYEHIATFTPILAKRLEKELTPILVLKPERKATLYVLDEGIEIIGDIHYIELPWEDILSVRRIRHGLALYLASQTILTVPGEPEIDQDKLEELQKAVQSNIC